ncbi:uroporphyrinogen decarboxylase family protein [Roseiflexus castenholzii]|uniref:Uroporphyrinogen decarboxylase (URO-D) n=1 Tax=Roseiflexus castenholzii (strain DSM 13941 / HLO8) TaxID=383372 RepID=A7NH05_ROSCS|nr:uroporphyrinogen decarboxylase family protein [Roseiflexus castenholzii]ABU56752.1 Uroporphyrinogen decarboxylase (URO-D) [Roseiflexus castenholzii DSM 13941]
MSMTRRERLAAAIRGEPVDRPPVALWRHFPVDDQDPEQLALSVAAFQSQYDWDFVKFTPSSSFCVENWGCRVVYRGHSEGTSDYVARPVSVPADWRRITPLDPRAGALGAHLVAVRRARALIDPDVPLLATVFSPISQAKNLIGGGMDIVHLRRHRSDLLDALEAITETTIRFVEAVLETGADGIFYAMQRCTADVISEAEYREVCRPLDMRILEAAHAASAAHGKPPFILLHLHGMHSYFDIAAEYPAQALNWHDRDTGPDLAEGARRFPGMVVGGLSQRDIVEGSPTAVQSLARQAIAAMGGRRMCLSTGCVMPTTAPWGNIRALRDVVGP